MAYSNSDLVKRIAKAKKERQKLTHITDKSNLSTQDKFKLGLCKHFIQFALVKKIKLKDLSEKTGIPTSRLSEITNYKIKKFTVDQLLINLAILAEHDSAIKAYLSFLEHAAELPLLKSAETKKITKRLKDASNSKFKYA